jgi:hypothetical protein
VDPLQTTRAALTGIREGIGVAKDIKQVGNEVNAFLDEEAKARVAWRKKQQQIQRRGDMVFVDAVKEYRIIRQIRDAEAQMYRDVEREFGKKAVQEVKTLITQLRKDHRELNDEYYRKQKETRREWGILLALSVIIYAFFKFMGLW